jgi:hypothetical protein
MSTVADSSGKSPGKHESVVALLNAFPWECDPKAIIRKLAREKIAIAKERGWKGPAFCPKTLASLFGIRCKEVHADIGGDGRILPYPDGKLWIEFCSGRSPERQRFTIFHEFAHTLFPDFCEIVPCHHAAPNSTKDPEREFENLCDIAASEMLLPLEDVKEDLAKIKQVSFEEFDRLSRRYEASIDATTHRFTELVDGVPCVVVFLTDQKGFNVGRGPLWVKYCCRNPSFKGYIPPGTTTPATSVAFRCYNNGEGITQLQKETWWPNGKPRTWLAQAIKLPEVLHNPDYSKVAVLLLPSSYKGKN